MAGEVPGRTVAIEEPSAGDAFGRGRDGRGAEPGIRFGVRAVPSPPWQGSVYVLFVGLMAQKTSPPSFCHFQPHIVQHPLPILRSLHSSLFPITFVSGSITPTSFATISRSELAFSPKLPSH